MDAPALRAHQSPLELALVDVHATLAELLAAADDQYAAVVERDRQRLEGVTRQQERLAVRLERAERKRLAALNGGALADAVAREPRLARLSQAIAHSVRELRARHANTHDLIEKAAELNGQTIQFLQHLVGVTSPTYGGRVASTPRPSVLLDGRA
jgi:flagellar biosynthesis/type III secretory pathway chaperone